MFTSARSFVIALAALGSALLLAAAFAFQHLGGLAPCALCLWQRWPHAAAVLIGALALATGRGGLAWAGMLAALATAGIGGFHAGVELGWWEGLASCSGGAALSGLSGADLLDPTLDLAAPVRCDAVAWSFLGLSMAAWNMIASLGLAGLWLAAARMRA
jgi:disulfide bond formation protein DsbB